MAFDILFNEGQRRYLESLNAYARRSCSQQAGPTSMRSTHSATVAIEQRTSRGGRKSTVATLTEIYHFLRCCTSSSACSIARSASAGDAASFDTIVAQCA